MLEPQNPEGFLDGIVSHFTDLDHIHSDLQATKAEIGWLEPIEQSYLRYKSAQEDQARFRLVGQTIQILLDREAGDLLDREIAIQNERKIRHEEEAARLLEEIKVIDKRILELSVSLAMNDSYAAIQQLTAEVERLKSELSVAKETARNLSEWLRALGYTEPVSTQAGFDRLQKHANGLLVTETQRQQLALEQRGAMLHDIEGIRKRRVQLGCACKVRTDDAGVHCIGSYASLLPEVGLVPKRECPLMGLPLGGPEQACDTDPRLVSEQQAPSRRRFGARAGYLGTFRPSRSLPSEGALGQEILAHISRASAVFPPTSRPTKKAGREARPESL